MSEFADFMTMKLIEERRLMSGGIQNKELILSILEQAKAVKNLNVRAPIHTIALVETLANRFFVSKAELVLEMLQSCIDDALKMIEKEGKLDLFMKDYYSHMEKDYGVILKRDDNGEVISIDFNQESQVKDDD